MLETALLLTASDGSLVAIGGIMEGSISRESFLLAIEVEIDLVSDRCVFSGGTESSLALSCSGRFGFSTCPIFSV